MPPSSTETTVLTKTRRISSSIEEVDEKNIFLNIQALGNTNQLEDIRIKINDKWLLLSKEFVASHPGGSVINQYKNADATHIFHAFHEGSEMAYKQLKFLESRATTTSASSSHLIGHQEDRGRTLSTTRVENVNVGLYDMTIEQEMKIVRNFEQLRQRVHRDGLMEERPIFYLFKVIEVAFLLSLSFTLQYWGYYLCSAFALAISWQQLGWLTHEFCHHQPLKNRRVNDGMGILLGNVCQGFSRDWWKDKHNSHHAATNIIDTDPDINLAPLVAMVPNDLLKYREPLERLALRIIPYQHLYFTLMLPLLRISWTSQSIVHVFSASSSSYLKDRKHAAAERIGIAIHWTWVLLQLYLLPNIYLRVIYFLISQLGGGLLIAVVVTYNHNSVDKFPENSRLLNNFAALHILTTRNMNSSPFIDWFWGGLNYQIEHHLFPTMPRPNLNACSKLVQEFCQQNKFPYLVDDYVTGYKASLRLLRNVAKLANQNNEKRVKE